MVFSSLSLASPLSLYSIPVVWFTAMYPNFLKYNAIQNTTGYNNVTPRANVADFANNKNISPKLVAKVRKLDGAHSNGLEAFPLWTAAILVANLAGLDNTFLNKMSIGFVALRILFNTIYINQQSNTVGYLRTVVFCVATSIPITLLIKGANKVAAL